LHLFLGWGHFHIGWCSHNNIWSFKAFKIIMADSEWLRPSQFHWHSRVLEAGILRSRWRLNWSKTLIFVIVSKRHFDWLVLRSLRNLEWRIIAWGTGNHSSISPSRCSNCCLADLLRAHLTFNSSVGFETYIAWSE
jgi:hypothetical protein